MHCNFAPLKWSVSKTTMTVLYVYIKHIAPRSRRTDGRADGQTDRQTDTYILVIVVGHPGKLLIWWGRVSRRYPASAVAVNWAIAGAPVTLGLEESVSACWKRCLWLIFRQLDIQERWASEQYKFSWRHRYYGRYDAVIISITTQQR